MNNGKICVSVCAETADDLIEQIKRAEELADVIEIRFDCLKQSEIDNFYSKIGNQWQINKKIPLITTLRLKEQGGFRELTQDERDYFWNSGFEIGWADCEEDIIENSFSYLWDKRICSYHDLECVPDNLFEIYEKLKETNADVLKIALQTSEITETIAVWKLLERWKAERENLKAKKLREIEELEKKINYSLIRPVRFLQIIPIAMGESGKWTRILGLAHGAFMTYASLDSGSETAPGQVSARDLIEVYRVKELDETTDVYGVLGSNTSVSMSPYIHNAAFNYHRLNAVFVPLQVQNLDEFIKRMVKSATCEIDLNFKGFAVTIPHKQSIIKHLDEIDETARRIGAVNTVRIVNGKLHGYNTDAQGFIEPLLNSYGDLKNARVAILGAGGAARACVYALKQHGADVCVFARDLANAAILAEDFEAEISNFKSRDETYGDFDILVNTTPLGMKGKFDGETPATAAQLKGLHLVYDLVYVPFQTPFMTEADRAEIPKIGGLAMLIAQAMRQQKIWTGLDAPMKEMSRAALERIR